MPEDERLVRVQLLGQEFSFYTAESEKNINEILELVRSVLGQDANKAKSSLAIAQTAILGCLTIASDYIKLQKQVDSEKGVEQTRISLLTSQIDKILDDPGTGNN